MSLLIFALKFTIEAEALLYPVLATKNTLLLQGKKKATRNQLLFSDPCHAKEQQGKRRSQFLVQL